MRELYATSGGAEFGISLDELVAIVEEALPKCAPGQARAHALKSLRVGDLVLARACARGNEAAWNCFITRYREKLSLAATAMARDETIGRELADSLYANLYGTRVQEDGRRVSKLDTFMGRGSLEGWLRTTLAQDYVNRFRSQRKFVAFDDRLEAPAKEYEIGPDLNAKHAALARATDQSLQELTEEERLLLTAYYLDGRTLAEVGRMLRAHESTVSRRLDKITARLRKRIIGRLCSEGLAKRAAEEMLSMDVRDLGIEMREKLAQERRG